MSDVHNHVVETERIGKLHVYVQGRTDGQSAEGQIAVFSSPSWNNIYPATPQKMGEMRLMLLERDSAVSFWHFSDQIHFFAHIL